MTLATRREDPQILRNENRKETYPFNSLRVLRECHVDEIRADE
jgi:hypothetical protein